MAKLCSRLLTIAGVAFLAVLAPLRAQIETVESPSPSTFNWVSHGRVEGHLALSYSPAGAFSPDSHVLAVVSNDKIVLLGLTERNGMKFVKPRIQGLTDLQFQSANFLSATRLFLLGTGLIPPKGKEPARATPLLAFQWDIQNDTLAGRVDAVSAKEGAGRPRYLAHISHLGTYRDSVFELWNPRTGRGGKLTISALTRIPNLYEPAPNGQWMLLAQVEGNSSSDPIVVRLKDQQFVDTLTGHQGTVLSMSFSLDSTRVVTACEDGNLRVYSAPDWKLLATLTGHQGPVHSADFSPDMKWIASAGEDHTVRIWSVEDGRLNQTLSESKVPMLSVTFSPNGEFVAASGEEIVFVWKRIRAD